MSGLRTMFDCGCHLRLLVAPVNWLASVNQLATRLWNPRLIDGRHSRYPALHSMICGPDTGHLVWTTDCDIPRVSLQKTDSVVMRIRQPRYRDLTFYKSGSRVNLPLTLSVRFIPRGYMRR
jgi:hypothetical protein